MARTKRRDAPRPRHPSVRRAEGYREQNSIVRIVAEGKATEPDYFNECIRGLIPAGVRCHVEPGGGDYATLIGMAKREERRFPDAEIWIVADTEDRAPAQYAPLEQWARGGTHRHLAVSNTMFEIWVLLHAETKPDTSSASARRLRELVKREYGSRCRYDGANKHLRGVVFTAADVRRAIDRARRRRASFGEGGDESVPRQSWCTTVDLLVESIIDHPGE